MAKPGNDWVSRISGKRKLRDLSERGGQFSVWLGVAMLGLFGWMIVLPTIAGIFLGRWLDKVFNQGISLTLTFMMLGLAIGGYNVWRAMHERP